MNDQLPPSTGALGNLSVQALKEEQEHLLQAPRRRYGVGAKVLFRTLDLVYGKARTVSKCKVLELVARVPYQAWEQVAYIAITHVHERLSLPKRIHERVLESRAQQDNEQWHLLMLDELIESSGGKEPAVRYALFPQVLAFFYYQLSFVLFVVRPGWSYRLNADFEDHAAHEYMLLVKEHPEWEEIPFVSSFATSYRQLPTLADLFRQVGHDELVHRDESVRRLSAPRFS